MKNKNLKLFFKNLEYAIPKEAKELLGLLYTLEFSGLVNRFLQDIRTKKFISVITNIKLVDGSHFTVGVRYPLDPSNKEEVNKYIDYLNSKYTMLDKRYKVIPGVTVYFNFTKVNEDFYIKTQALLKGEDLANKALEQFDFRDEIPVNLPLNTNYSTWGTNTEWLSSNVLLIKDLLVDQGTTVNRYLKVQIEQISRTVEIFSGSGDFLTSFTDKLLDKGNFIRQVGDKVYHIAESKISFIYERLNVQGEKITKARTATKFSLNMLTLDVETYVETNDSMSIYCISLYDGVKAQSFYITDYDSINSLMNHLLTILLSREYTQRTVYIHNSSAFDLIFILKYLVNFTGVKVEPIIKDGKFINIKVNYGPTKKYFINFKDSYLLLPASLEKLAKAFKANSLKTIFPHKFVTKEKLNYVGDLPGYEFFDSLVVSVKDYLNYNNKFNEGWFLKFEAIKYCEQDCKALYEVIETFSNLIFEKFNINVSSVSTLPSLAFKIFRAKFLPKDLKLPVLTGKIYSDISNAFYGGHVDMYIPSNPIGTKVYHYDVNSLYPYAMKENLYPSKIFAYFRGDITKMTNYIKLFLKSVSVLKVKVTTPKGLANPILPFKINGTTVYGEGSWIGWYYSSEINNAIKLGYQFEILEGYLFESSNIFTSYVEAMYKIKEKAGKDSPWYTIAKNLLNSLFGRFGMKPFLLNHEVVNTTNVSKFVSEIGLDNLINTIILGDKTLISYYKDFSKAPKINIAIASAITAEARVYMAKFKNNLDFTLYYSDTDSYFFNKPLPDHLINDKEIGLFKLENVLNKFIALATKVYGGRDLNGIEFTKTKGLKTNTSLDQLERLLIKNNTLNFEHEKWFTHISEGSITIQNLNYKLKPTETKRNLIYNNKNKLVGTSNKIINEE